MSPRFLIVGDPEEAPDFDGMDEHIRDIVRILWENGIETFESCDGSKGHAFPEPTVRFGGTYADGFRALSVAFQHGLKVSRLNREWPCIDGEPTGPYWAMTFYLPTQAFNVTGSSNVQEACKP